MHARLRCWLWLAILILLPDLLWAQVSPPSGGGGGSLFPVTVCTNAVGTGMTQQGILTCAPVTPAMTTGLVPSGVDVNTTGQVTATHLASPLPLGQGGLGITAGNSGGVLYFPTSTTVAASPLLPLNAPLFGGGDGAPPVPGTRSGTTLEVGTILGPHSVNKQLAFDANGNIIASDTDIGAGSGGGGGSVSSVFGRTGAVIAQSGDYTAAQVTNAADRQQANVFAHPSGQTMPKLVLSGAVAGSLTLQPPAFAGTSSLTFPGGVLDMTTTGGPGQVVRQQSAAGPLTVGQLAFTDLSGTGNVCTTTSICAGYQASLGFTPENTANKSPATTLGNSNSLFPTQNAVKVYVDTGLASKQNTLGFVAEDSGNKSSASTLGTSNILYPTQGAVKLYVDNALAALPPGGVTDGLKNDITVSGGGTVWTINPATVTYAKLQQTSAGAVLLGRGSLGPGTVQEITVGSGLSLTGTNPPVLSSTAGGGNVTASGTPVDNQVGVWTSATGVEGTAALTYAGGVLQVGIPGSTLGQLALAGNVSGMVILQPPATAGSYNFNLPNAAGTAGQVLTSGGGGVAAMTWTTPGDASTNTSTSVDGELALYAGATGKLLKRATQSGLLKATAGVLGVAAAGTDYVVPGVDINASHQVTATHLASALPVGQGGTGLTIGTSGGVPYFSTTTTLASSGLLTANAPILGGGAGSAPVSGTRSGTTTEFGTITGTKTPNKQLAFDASGNIVASASDLGGGGGSAHVILDEAVALAQRPNLNFVGPGVTCTDSVGTNSTICTVPGTAGGLPDPGSNGLVVRTGAGPTVAARTIQGTTNQITVTNGDGVAGNITLQTPQDLATSSAVRFGQLGLNEPSPSLAGLFVGTGSANNVTLLRYKRFTDSGPLGNFLEFQTAAGTSLWTIDITGSLSAGIIPVARITGLAPSATTDTTNAANLTSGLLAVARGGTGLGSGTSGGVLYYSGTTTLASSPALTANAPILGGGPGASPASGARSGNTTEFATISGAKTANKQLTFDASGNVIASATDISLGDVTAVGSCTTGDCFTTGSPSASLVFNNATSGTVTLQAVTGALGSQTVRLPAQTGTLCTDAALCGAAYGDARTANPLSQFGLTTSAQLAGVVTDETGSASGGLLMFNQSPVILTPTIASLVNAQHTHQNAAGGGQLTDAALSSPVTVAKGGTGLGSGTSGGIPYFSSTSAIASSALLTANAPILGGGVGAAPTSGTRSGNTTEFGTTSGTKTANKQLTFDASGNVIASAFDVGAAGAGGDITGVGDCLSGQCDRVSNFGVNPRTQNAGTGSPLAIDVGLYDQIHIADLAGTTTLSCPTASVGSIVNGQLVLISFYTSAKRDLVWTTGTGCFTSENGTPLPPSTLAAAYLEVLLRYNALSSRWSPVWTSRESPQYTAYTEAQVASPGVNVDTTRFAHVASVTGALAVANPGGTPQPGQLWRLSLCSSASQALTFPGGEFRAGYGLDLPVATTGAAACDLFGFQRSPDNTKWDLISTSQSSVSAKRRTCVIAIEKGGTALVDADLAIKRRCDIPTGSTIEEISVIAESSGTPSVSVHRTPATYSATALLSSALPTAASGALACARKTAVAGFSGITCAATLQNETTTGEVWLGITSGAASTNTTDLLITIHYLLTS